MLEYASETKADLTNRIKVKGEDVIMGDRRAELLFTGRTREMIIIDHQSRAYTVVDERSARELGEQMSVVQEQMAQALTRMRAQLEQMPQDQRAMVEKLLAQQERSMSGSGRSPKQLRFQAVGRQVVAGRDCERVIATENGQSVREFCVVTPASLGVGDRDFATLAGAMTLVKEMMQAMSAGFSKSMSMDLSQMRGIPVQIKNLGDADVVTLRAVSTSGLDPSTFSVPKGYRNHPMTR